ARDAPVTGRLGSRAMANALARRHLALLLDDLRADPARAATALPGPVLSPRGLQAPSPEIAPENL
ncbi:MAG TPA: hypothetical protein VIL85_24960, partial [Thermomicrobiales bacterium]